MTLKLRDHNVISGAYKHVDGTSFAAPIVSAIAALIVEANPGAATARREAPDRHRATHRRKVEVDRQGWGVVDVRARSWLWPKKPGRLGRRPVDDPRRMVPSLGGWDFVEAGAYFGVG